MEKQYTQFSTSIPNYSASTSNVGQNKVGISWEKVIGKEVKSADDIGLGKVRSTAADYIEVKEDKLDKKHYYIPKLYVE